MYIGEKIMESSKTVTECLHAVGVYMLADWSDFELLGEQSSQKCALDADEPPCKM